MPLEHEDLVAARMIYPTGLLRLHLLLDDLGQPNPDQLFEPIVATPLSWTVEHTPYDEADTAEFVLEANDFPLDPRLIRGATVEFFQADAKQIDEETTGSGAGLQRKVLGGFWERALNPDPPEGLWPGKPLSAPELDAERHRIVNETVTLFVGVVDEIGRDFESDGKIRVTLFCRDYTAYFLDVEPEPSWVKFKDGSRNLSLVEMIEHIVAQRPKTEAIEVVAWPRDNPPDDVFPADYDFRAEMQDGEEEGAENISDGESIWQLIQEMAVAGGRMVTVWLDQILVMEPATIFPGSTTPADSGIDPLGTADRNSPFRFVLGLNIKAMRDSRLMARRLAPNVIVTSYNPRTQKVLESRWVDPDTGSERASVTASSVLDDDGKVADIEEDVTFQRYTFRNITSQAQLDEIARQIGEQIRNREVEAILETSDMVDAEGRSFTGLHYGSPVYIDYRDSFRSFSTFDPEVQAAQLVLRSREDGVHTGLTDEQAQKLVDALQRFQLPYYCHRVKHSFDSEGEGYELFVELRSRHQVVVEEAKQVKAGRVTIAIEPE